MAAAVSFTGGKDSVLALHLYAGFAYPGIPMHEHSGLPIKLLVTFVPMGSNAQSFKAHPLPIIQAQARALQLPHQLVEIDSSTGALASYQQQIRFILKEQHGISVLVTGDILDVAGGFMQRAVEGSGVQLVTPLWQLPRQVVHSALQDLGIRSSISCINLTKYCCQQRQQQQQQQEMAEASACSFDAVKQLLGEEVTKELLAGPLTVAEAVFGADLCGENGEYHTIAFSGPMFKQALTLQALCVELCPAGVYAHIRWQCDVQERGLLGQPLTARWT